jgi:O-antigen ligase
MAQHMRSSVNSAARFAPDLAFALFAAFLVFLWIAGGASRADVIGQVITRGVAWSILLVFILLAPRPHLTNVRPVAALLFAATALAALHLVPLPPSVWTELPGRGLLIQAGEVLGEEQPWRPLSMSPGATANALSSLIVPILTLFLAAALSRMEQWRIVAVLLGLVAASSVLGLLQFSGARFDHPFLNDVAGVVSASFANRNHFALFAAIGCILAPGWAFGDGHGARWKQLAAFGLVILFGLMILASGSRAGLVLGALGIAIGAFNVRRQIAAQLRRLPRKLAVVLVAGALGLLLAAVVLSVTLGRAVSLDRGMVMDMGEDLRLRALPVIVDMAQLYFPAGSGLGTFDPVYRIHEPSALLGRAYLNHAHNDWLEIALDAGLPGLLIAGAAVLWWLAKSIAVWTGEAGSAGKLPRMGSGILLLAMVASVTDYPLRTPMIMAVVVIAAVWLSADAKAAEAAGSSSR